jgi:hypothetical protein
MATNPMPGEQEKDQNKQPQPAQPGQQPKQG